MWIVWLHVILLGILFLVMAIAPLILSSKISQGE